MAEMKTRSIQSVWIGRQWHYDTSTLNNGLKIARKIEKKQTNNESQKYSQKKITCLINQVNQVNQIVFDVIVAWCLLDRPLAPCNFVQSITFRNYPDFIIQYKMQFCQIVAWAEKLDARERESEILDRVENNAREQDRQRMRFFNW